MKLFKHAAAVLAFALVFTACTKNSPKVNTPEGVLEQYVQTAFSAHNPADRDKLVALSTGEAADLLKSMSGDDFKKRFIDNPMRFVSLHTKDMRQDQAGGVSLVYELAFKDGTSPNAVEQTNKKIAYLVRDEKGDWKIKGTKNIKSVIERKDDLEVLTPETTNKEPATGK
jgi:hypothetical protein